LNDYAIPPIATKFTTTGYLSDRVRRPLANEKDYDLTNGEDTDDTGAITVRNSYVGLKGSFGSFLVGRHDTPLKASTSKLDLFDDTMADYQGTLGFNDIRADNSITYISELGGLKFAIAFVPGAASTIDGGNGNHPFGWFDPGFFPGCYLIESKPAKRAAEGHWYGSAAYQLMTSKLSANNGSTKAAKVMRFGLGIRDLGGFYLSGIYEKQGNINFVKG